MSVIPWKQAEIKRAPDNNLLELTDAFPMTLEELQKTMDPSKYVGRGQVR